MSAPVFPGNTSSAVSSIPPTHHTPPTTEDSMASSKYESAYAEAVHDPKSGKVIGINMRVNEHAFKYGYWKFSPLDHRTQTEAYKLGFSRPEDMILAYKNGVCGSWVDTFALLWCPGALEENKTPLIATIPKHMATIDQEKSIMGFLPNQQSEIPVYSLSCGNAKILKVRSATMYTAQMPAPVYIPPMTQVVRQPSNAPHPSGPSNPPYGGPAAPITQPFGGQPTVTPYHPPGPSNYPYGGPAAPVPQGLNNTAGPSDLTSYFHGFPPNPPMTQPLGGQPAMAPYYPPGPSNAYYGGLAAPVLNGLNMTAGPVNTSYVAPYHPPGPSNASYGGPAAPVLNGLNMTAGPANTSYVAPYHPPGPSNASYGGLAAPVLNELSMTAGPVNTSSGPSTYVSGVLPDPSYTFPGVIPNPPTVSEVPSDMSDIADFLFNPSTSLSEILSSSSSTVPEGSGVSSSSTRPEVLSVDSPPTIPGSPLVDSPFTLPAAPSGPSSPSEITLNSSATLPDAGASAQVTSGTINPSELTLNPSATLPNAEVSAQVTLGAPSPSEAASNIPATPRGAELSAPGLSPLFDKPSSGVPAPELDPIWGQPWHEEGPPARPLDAEAAEAAEAAYQGSRWEDIFNTNTMEWLEDLPGF